MLISQAGDIEILNKRICIRVKHLILVLIILLIGGFLFFTNVHSFLAKQDTIQTDVLVVEGWLPGYALEQVKKEFEAQNYKMIITTGGPLLTESYFAEYKNHAHWAAVILEKMGMDPELIHVVPAPHAVKDRTYTAALALKEWIQENQIPFRTMNLVSLDAHARRSRLFFQKALGKEFSVGIIAVDDRNFDGSRWWKSSRGVRMVLNEWIAYCYARIFLSFSKKGFQ